MNRFDHKQSYKTVRHGATKGSHSNPTRLPHGRNGGQKSHREVPHSPTTQPPEAGLNTQS